MMSMFKKAKVIMLPTNEKANIGDLGLSKHVLNFAKNNDWINIYNPIKQHIYIISDDEIKEGDWFLYYNKHNQIEGIAKFIKEEGENNTLVEKYSKITGFSKFYIGILGCKKYKIIATTDTSLTLYIDGYNMGKSLPQPSQQFIQKFIKEYNKGNVITDVLVEYEIKSNAGLDYNEWVYLQHIEGKRYIPIKIEANIHQDTYELDKEDIFEDFEVETNLKINPKDNTITIKKVKDSYTREEVVQLLIDCCAEISSINGKLKGKEPADLYKWIEENL